MRACLGTQRWAPWWVPAALGVLFGVAGAPRCPLAVAEATAALAWRRTEGWGPAQLADEQRSFWDAAVGWAGAPRAALALLGPVLDLRRERAALAEASERAAGLGERRLHVLLARSLYCALWATRWELRAEHWFLGRSTGRRWLPTRGEEWRLLPAIASYGPAFHVLRALCGGLRGPAGARSAGDRARCPWRCASCDQPSVRWAWRTPSLVAPGLAFCVDCLGPGVRVGTGVSVALALLGVGSGALGLAVGPPPQLCWAGIGTGAIVPMAPAPSAALGKAVRSICFCGVRRLPWRGLAWRRIVAGSCPRL